MPVICRKSKNNIRILCGD